MKVLCLAIGVGQHWVEQPEQGTPVLGSLGSWATEARRFYWWGILVADVVDLRLRISGH